MTNSAKNSLNAARAAKAAALTRRIVARQLGNHGHGIYASPKTAEAGRTSSGAIIRKIVQPPGQPIREKSANAGRPQGATHWPDPRQADAKPRPSFAVTANGRPLPPKLAELIAARLKPLKCDVLVRWERRLTGPTEKPADWPATVPFYPGCTIDQGIAAVVATAEARAASFR